MMNEFGGHGWGMGWWWIIGLVVVVAIVWMVVKAMNQSNNPGNQSVQKSSLDILKDRYARGEIDKKEFDERKRDLM